MSLKDVFDRSSLNFPLEEMQMFIHSMNNFCKRDNFLGIKTNYFSESLRHLDSIIKGIYLTVYSFVYLFLQSRSKIPFRRGGGGAIK